MYTRMEFCQMQRVYLVVGVLILFIFFRAEIYVVFMDTRLFRSRVNCGWFIEIYMDFKAALYRIKNIFKFTSVCGVNHVFI